MVKLYYVLGTKLSSEVYLVNASRLLLGTVWESVQLKIEPYQFVNRELIILMKRKCWISITNVVLGCSVWLYSRVFL